MNKILITGGAGFIGINTANYYLDKGWKVVLFDNLSRKGTEINLLWIKKHKNKKNLLFVKGDIRKDQRSLVKNLARTNLVLHLAGQVAVTTSVTDPREDFEINALGTFNVLEAVRASGANPVFIYSSTNKVYGELEEEKVLETKTRYVFKDLKSGVSEKTPVDFHSPYGCSKGAGDQYVRDYHRIYGLNTIVFRQSCIYGEHQFGIEDQGWLAWFIIALAKGKQISIYGTGKQVRDALYIKDLVRAYDLAYRHKRKTVGQIYNIGGGPKNTISVWFEFVPLLEKLFGKKIRARFAPMRPGDQPIYVSDLKRAKKDFGWSPKTSVTQGVKLLYSWVISNKDIFFD